MQTQQPTIEVDYSRKWYAMATVAMGIFLATIDASIVNIALPTMVRDFQTNFATIQWVPLAYLLVVTTLMLSVGRLADMIGKKAIYTYGIIIFTIGSILCGLSPGVGWLIAARIIQAIGAAMNMALGAAIVTEAFPPSERGKALGIIGSVVAVGVIFGPTAGGILIDMLSWHWIFFVNIPIGVAGAFMSNSFLPKTPPANKEQTFDFAGAITLFMCLTALLLALTVGQQIGFLSLPIIALFVLFIILLAVFILIEKHNPEPMLNLDLFKNQNLNISLIMGLLTFIAIAGTVILIPFYLENILGYNTRKVGILMAVVPILLGITSPISGILSDRFGSRKITLIGLVFLILGYGLLTRLDEHTSTLMYILYFTPIGIGMGVFQSPNNSTIMGAAPPSQMGVVSGLMAVSRVMGQTVGTAILGALWAARVFAHVGRTLEDGATAAPISAQVAGMQESFIATIVLIIIALVLGVWRLKQDEPQK